MDSEGPPVDMPDDPGDDVPDLTYRTYVIDDLDVPMTSMEAREYGIDLDGDGLVDNQLGNVIATLSTMGIEADVQVARSIDRGETILLARLGTTSMTDAMVATFQTYAGSNPSIPACTDSTDTVCRHHLDGTASFTASATPTGMPLKGSFVAGAFSGSGGQLVVRLALLGSAPIDVVLLGSQVRVAMASDDELGPATLAGAVSEADIDGKVIPAVRDNVMAAVTRDCTALTSPPACGCPTGSDGKQSLALFDKSPVDCSISITEVQNNGLVQSLLAPDVTVGGMPGLSLGVRVSAVKADFSVPF